MLRAPLTLPVAYDWLSAPWLLPTRPPIISRAPVTTPLAYEVAMLAPDTFHPARPPMAPPPSAFTPVTAPLLADRVMAPPLLPTRPPTLRWPLTAMLLFTLSIVPLTTLPASAPTFAVPVTLPPVRVRLRKVAPCTVPNRPAAEPGARLRSIFKLLSVNPAPSNTPKKPLPLLAIGTKPRPLFQFTVPLASILPARR